MIDCFAVLSAFHTNSEKSLPDAARLGIEAALQANDAKEADPKKQKVLPFKEAAVLTQRGDRGLSPRDLFKWAQRVTNLRWMARGREEAGAGQPFLTEEVCASFA